MAGGPAFSSTASIEYVKAEETMVKKTNTPTRQKYCRTAGGRVQCGTVPYRQAWQAGEAAAAGRRGGLHADRRQEWTGCEKAHRHVLA